nr:hypothetical protein [uncultured Desulfuromonas sp.]
MPLIPYEKFSLSSTKSTEDLVATLSQSVASIPSFSVFQKVHKKPFEGKFSENGFRVKRVTHYLNSFIPIVKGRFRQSLKGTTVTVQIFPHPISCFFIFAVTIFGLIFGAAVGSFSSKQTSLVLVLPVILGLVSYIAVWCGFWFEAKKTKKELLQLITETGGHHS